MDIDRKLMTVQSYKTRIKEQCKKYSRASMLS